MDLPDVFQNLAIALGLGLLVGLQREWAETRTAGIRTFPLIALLGALCALLARELGTWILPAGFLAVGAVVVVSRRAAGEEQDPGITTEIAALVMFAVGAVVMAGYTAPAVVIGGTVAVLLHWKTPMHQFVHRLGESESRAIFRLALIGLVILPVLPDRSYGPYEVLNPREIWLMVVLIVGISLVAYVAQRLLGSRAGTLLSGVLGGLVSSTASSVSYARGARQESLGLSPAVVLSMLASTAVFLRVLGEIALVVPSELASMAPPLVAMMALMVLLSTVVFLRSGRHLAAPAAEAPSDLKGALLFGLLYGVVLLGVALGHEHLGERGLYAVAALSGLTDMDSITLSTAQLVRSGELAAATGWRLVVVGTMANLVFKAGVVAVLGTGRMLGLIALLYGTAVAGGALLLVLWS